MFAKQLSARFGRDSHELQLVKPDEAHADLAINWVSNYEVTRFLGVDFSTTTVDGERLRIREMIDSDDRYSWMIKCDDVIVGNIELNEIRKMSEKYSASSGALSILIGEPDYWGRGIGGVAIRTVVDWAFSAGRFMLIEGRTLKHNERSWRSLQSLGFDYVGVEDDMKEKKVANGMTGVCADNTVQWDVYVLRCDGPW